MTLESAEGAGLRVSDRFCTKLFTQNQKPGTGGYEWQLLADIVDLVADLFRVPPF
jgi:hypothetical protein